MGCGASAAASEKQQQYIYAEMSKEMMILCVAPALEKASSVKIPAPKDIDQLKTAAKQLRDAAPSSEPAPESGGGGGIGGMLQQGMNMAKNVASQGATAVLGGVASGLEASVAKVEEPFTQVGAGVIADKKGEIVDVLCTHINAANVPEEKAEGLCTGAAGAITEHLVTQAAPKIAESLQPKVEESIKGQKGLQAWNGAIDAYNAALKKISEVQGQVGVPEVGVLKPIQLDIVQYTCEETVKAIAGLMAAEEAAIRQSPVGKAKRCPEVFAKVFKNEPLSTSDFKAVKNSVEASGN